MNRKYSLHETSLLFLNPRYAIIIPVQNEAECLGEVLSELKSVLADRSLADKTVIAVGLNASTDDSRSIATSKTGIIIGETDESGYGHGCIAAIQAADTAFSDLDAYLFFAGDGANHPDDLGRLIRVYESCGDQANFVMGLRKFELSTWRSEFGRALPNLLLGVSCAALGGQFFHDLGPLRLITKRFLERIDPQELTWGWTIEAQIMASRLDENIYTLPVMERPRIAGQQKVSGVSLSRSARIGWEIFQAAVRTRFRKLPPNEQRDLFDG